jgi:hypothetical protein
MGVSGYQDLIYTVLLSHPSSPQPQVLWACEQRRQKNLPFSKKNKNHQVSWEHFPGFSDSPNRSCNAQEKEEKVATILVMLVEV